MRPTLTAALAAASLLSMPSARAGVTWHDWSQTSFQAAVDQAAREKRRLVLVVTQPDWCPPCIQINRKWLDNPEDTKVAEMTREALVLEVLGYDPAGAEHLRQQEVRFAGTPTTHVFSPDAVGAPLGRQPLVGSVVGAPADFPDKLASLLGGSNPVPGLRKAAESAKGSVEQAGRLLELARAHAARGEAAPADLAYERVMKLPGEDAKLKGLRADAEWGRVDLDLRVRKDAAAALARIDAYKKKYRNRAEKPEVTVARAWALGHLGRDDEAIAEMEKAHPVSGTLADHSAFAYFAFRIDRPAVLARGEERTRAALAQFPDSAVLHQDLARILRRQGRYDEALIKFHQATELAAGEDERTVYRDQLEYARRESTAVAAARSETKREKTKAPTSRGGARSKPRSRS